MNLLLKYTKTVSIYIPVFLLMFTNTITCSNNLINSLYTAGNTIDENIELIRAIGCLMQTPDILFSDSENSLVIQSNVLLAATSTNIKLFHYLASKKETRPIIELSWYIPKAMVYLLSQLHDVFRLADAKNIALKNKNILDKRMTKIFKINQGLQLLIEGLLRILVCMNTAQQKASGHIANNNISFWLTETADLVEIWRIIGRYSNFFKISVSPNTELKDDEKVLESDINFDLNVELSEMKNNILSTLEDMLNNPETK